MGYSTYFSGEFRLSARLTTSQVAEIQRLTEIDGSPDGVFVGPCVWHVGPGDQSLVPEHDEKVYGWRRWLVYLLENVLEPDGVRANGRVYWHGEDVGDAGIIFVRDNKVRFFSIEEVPEPDWGTP